MPFLKKVLILHIHEHFIVSWLFWRHEKMAQTLNVGLGRWQKLRTDILWYIYNGRISPSLNPAKIFQFIFR